VAGGALDLRVAQNRCGSAHGDFPRDCSELISRKFDQFWRFLF
jgi:hypothetical protein